MLITAEPTSPRTWASYSNVIAGSLSALAGTYAFVVPRGLPYDEPSHWAYVRYLADHWSMPVIGDPSVGYEAQMGPVAYLPGAALLAGARLLGWSDDEAFLAVRLLGAGLLFGLFVAARSLAMAAVPHAPGWAATIGAGIAVFNPMVVAMSMSVQNDTGSLLLLMALLMLACRQASPPRLPTALGIGGLAGAVLLAKVSLTPAVTVALLWFLIRFRRSGLRPVLLMAASAAAVSGWWFVRNLSLYGDVTGRTAVNRLGLEFRPLGWDSSTIGHLGRSVVVYLTLPVEYYRNTIQGPGLVEAIAAAMVIFVAVAGSLALRAQRRSELRLLMAVGAVSVLAWSATAVWVQAVAFRTAYGVLPLWAAAGVAALYRRRSRWSIGLVVGIALSILSLHVWVLTALSGVTYTPGLRL